MHSGHGRRHVLLTPDAVVDEGGSAGNEMSAPCARALAVMRCSLKTQTKRACPNADWGPCRVTQRRGGRRGNPGRGYTGTMPGVSCRLSLGSGLG